MSILSKKEKEVVVPADNIYANQGASELNEDLDKLQDEYDVAIRATKTKAQRESIMRAHQDFLMDLGMKCTLENDYTTKTKIDKVIDSIDTRLYRRKRNRY